MHTHPVSLLIVDDDGAIVRMLADAAHLRGYRAIGATSLAETEAALGHRNFDVALVDLGLGSESGFDVIRRIKDLRFHKFVSKRVKYKAHDEKNEYKTGDRVLIVESRPLSRDKRWRVEKLIEKAPEA